MGETFGSPSALVQFLPPDGPTLVVCHRHADLDAIGSALALAEFLPDVTVCAPGGIGMQAKPLARGTVERADPAEFALTIVVDAAESRRVEPIDLDRAGTLIVIDHHEPGDLLDRADAALVVPEAGATAELVYKLAGEAGWDVSETAAYYLLAGIMGDTKRLAFAEPATFDVVVDLLPLAGDRAHELPAVLGPTWREGERVACLRAMQRLDLFRSDDLVAAVTHVGSYASTAASAIVDAGADLAVVLSGRDFGTRVAVRTNGSVHVDTVLDPLLAVFDGSGGGHDDAGVANLHAERDVIRTRLDEVLRASLGFEPY
ncbi:bifunctional oligoribonuclease/PAP phosphatase NrnA [Haloarchaeobius sp. HME9146]|uniref:DHH family phosphoesterase n=1 Tax=Haloarchaeobius sp. HME9146 TaxID=2978732 RepID=UPI0021C225B0|nr:DHH family phosphoesterase [Haloarchaeobius sp. HME9146]MCT9098437.1 DHH family phosphoesterase [Haloarchaeobius sp. HME9146]